MRWVRRKYFHVKKKFTSNKIECKICMNFSRYNMDMLKNIHRNFVPEAGRLLGALLPASKWFHAHYPLPLEVLYLSWKVWKALYLQLNFWFITLLPPIPYTHIYFFLLCFPNDYQHLQVLLYRSFILFFLSICYMPDCVLKTQVTRINKTRWEMSNIMWQVPQKKNKQCMGKGGEVTLPERIERPSEERQYRCYLMSKHLKGREKGKD